MISTVKTGCKVNVQNNIHKELINSTGGGGPPIQEYCKHGHLPSATLHLSMHSSMGKSSAVKVRHQAEITVFETLLDISR